MISPKQLISDDRMSNNRKETEYREDKDVSVEDVSAMEFSRKEVDIDKIKASFNQLVK